jgi:hypothetical protein
LTGIPGNGEMPESKEPRLNEREHAEVMKRLSEIGGQFDEVRKLVSKR